MRRLLSFLLFVILLAVPAATLLADDADETLLLRFPDIHGEQIAFVYAGDIWMVSSTGGTARRLTSHQGLEVFPKFSPDGQWIAFSGEYSGSRQVFVISVNGGTPRQLTFYNDVGPMPPRGGFDNRILGWTPDGRNIVFRANRLPWGVRMGRPYMVSLDGGLETPMAIPEGGGGDLSPDGTRMAYTPMDREFRTWKRYRGGRAQDVWIYDLKKDTAEPITDLPATDNQPVWVDDTVYYTSDRDWKLNLYAYNTRSGDTRQVTRHKEYDVLWPSGGPGAVVYENGGAIWRYDTASGKSRQVPIHVAGDLPHVAPTVKNVSDNIEWFELSPSGARALFAARGEVFTVPAEHGEPRNITRSQGVRELSPVWSPDGRQVAYLSDRSGEYEVWVRDQDGSGEEKRITTDGDIWRFPLLWSPDGEKLAFGDKKQRLRYVEVDSGRVVDVDRSQRNDITTYAWSPDSNWLAYTKVADTLVSQIWLYSLEDEEASALTDPLIGNFSPVFDPEGRYLYFFSNRDFNLTFSGYEFAYLYTGPTRLYMGTLNTDVARPFQPRSDEEEPGEDHAEDSEEAEDSENAEKEGDDEADEKDDDDKPLRIDIDGFNNRVVAVPGPAGNYSQLAANADGPLYVFGDGNGPGTLKIYNIEDEKEETILEKIGGYALSRDGKKLIYSAGDNRGIIDVKPGQKSGDGKLNLAHMDVRIDPRAEWAQMYMDAWRTLRDWFYDPDLHGVDWEKMKRRYEHLLPHVAHRADLDYILGELGGELNTGHFYVQSGDQPGVERRDGGLLGAELEAHESGYYRIMKIFPGENWHSDFRSPLTEPGVDVKEGEFIIAIDGEEVTTRDNPYRFLQNKAGRQVTLTINDKPTTEDARQVQVRPIARETNLRYLDWVKDRRRRVAELSDGRIGYIHLPNTAGAGNRELFKYFYPQSDTEALIVDVRYNGGGFIPDRMIELLDRPVLNYWVRRGLIPGSTPAFSHTGPKVCLINGYSSSGGDAFPYYFRKRGLGSLLGMRTWGGLIGLSGNPGFVDGGTVLVPTFRFMDTDGEWAVENEGISPDIEVLDDPAAVVRGEDPTLEKGVALLLQELKKNPTEAIKAAPRWQDRHAN